MEIEIGSLLPGERECWAELWRLYLEFYHSEVPAARYDITWRRLLEGHDFAGLGARWDGRLVGIAHYLFHTHTWMDDVCYLGDLYVDPSMRGQGVGGKLIARLAEICEARGCPKLYWNTHQTNTTARRLYDQVATFKGSIRYEHNALKP